MEIKAAVPSTSVLEGLDAQSLKLRQQAAEKKKEAAGKVAKEFESLFVGMMLKSMRETVGKDKLTGGGHGEEAYQSMLDQEYAKAVAASGSLGLARTIEQQLSGDGVGKRKSDR